MYTSMFSLSTMMRHTKPAAFSGLTAACFHFLISKIAPSKNGLYLLALALDFASSCSQLNSHKQKDNEMKMAHINFLRWQGNATD